MRCGFLLLLLFLAGCASSQPGISTTYSGKASSKPPPRQAAAPKSPKAPELIVTPGTLKYGKISSVNPGARFVVMTFRSGQLPDLERRLGVYRNGLKVAEVKITGPHRDTNTVGDIVAGECQPGDEVRDD